jgi:tape measure domain-containing protein
MGEYVEFILRMKDTMSGMWPKVAATAQSTFNGMNASVATTQSNLDKLSRPIKMQVDSSAIDQVNGKLKQISSMQLIGGVAVGNMVSNGIQSTARAMMQQAMDVKKLGFEAGANIAQFQVLAGPEQGMKLYKELTKYVQDSVFGPELYKDARTMMAFGVAVNEVMPDMKMLGDVAMGDAERMGALTLAFSQTKAAGKLMGQDLLQYVNAGFNPLQVMTEQWQKFGFKQKVTLDQLRDLTSEGKISSDMVRRAFEVATGEGGKFHDMLNKMADKPFGMEQAMLGSIEGAKQGLGLSLSPQFKQVMEEFRPMVDALPQTLETMRPAIAGMVNDFASLVHWTRTHTETIGKWFGVIKVGAEAFIAWKVGTVALTAANWAWVQSVGAATTQAVTESTVLAEQEAMVDSLAVSYEELTVAISGMTVAQREAALLQSQAAFAIPLNTTAAAASANAAAAGLAGGFIGAASKAAIPVAIWSIASGVLGELMPKGMADEKFSLFNSQTDWMQYFASLMAKDSAAAGKLGHALGKVGAAATGEAADGGKPKKDLTKMMQDVSDSVVGGGARQVNLNFKNIVETINNNPNNKGEAIKMTEQDLKEVLYKVFAGLPK